ncbi:SDR family oxidoreductase [Celeribacter litoreus]|uniref:SDR family oxidoreductase n=1 Tax=Celeribacter litoreus TaxID=2876714 RepID=UPI001CCFCA13|nr:SDR family oxidoreductase [Celeribacter litoreus]MCA0044288.1 SDR family oxidoreductase [Celeribacter litoreus]
MKKALVTGAARRLGRAMALSLGEAGYDVAVHCNGSVDEAEEVAERIRAMGNKAAVIQADLLNDAETESVVARASEALDGRLTLLVNNASIFEEDALGSITGESWHRHMQSNLHAPVLLTQAFAKQAPAPLSGPDDRLVAQALVVNMIDQRVHKLTPQFMSYTLAKSALWTFTRTAAQSLAPAVRVNGIGPGPTLQGDRQSEEDFTAQQQATLLQRGADPADVCAALLYLASAPSVTGQMLCVDGGQHLAWETADINVQE